MSAITADNPAIAISVRKRQGGEMPLAALEGENVQGGLFGVSLDPDKPHDLAARRTVLNWHVIRFRRIKLHLGTMK